MTNPIQITLDPEHEKFIDAALLSGRFASAEQVVAEALTRLIEDADEIDDETCAALQRGDQQLARGEGRAWEGVQAELRAKYARR